MTEQRYQAILAVIRDGRTVTEVASEWRVSRQTVHTWLSRYEAGGRRIGGPPAAAGAGLPRGWAPRHTAPGPVNPLLLIGELIPHQPGRLPRGSGHRDIDRPRPGRALRGDLPV